MLISLAVLWVWRSPSERTAHNCFISQTFRAISRLIAKAKVSTEIRKSRTIKETKSFKSEKPAISIKSRDFCWVAAHPKQHPTPCKWRQSRLAKGSDCNEQVHGESRAGGLMTGLIVYQQICVFHIKRQTRGAARARRGRIVSGQYYSFT